MADNLKNSDIRILEVDYDVENAYKQGHIPGAHMVRWKKDINDPTRRDIINKQQFETLMSGIGATPETELILYGDFNNWFAAFALWVFHYYGHRKIKIMNGGRRKWEMENREYTKEEPIAKSSKYVAQPPDEGIRAYLPDVKRAIERVETGLSGCKISKRIFRRNYSPTGISYGTCTKRWSYSKGSKHTMGTGNKRGWHIQKRR